MGLLIGRNVSVIRTDECSVDKPLLLTSLHRGVGDESFWLPGNPLQRCWLSQLSLSVFQHEEYNTSHNQCQRKLELRSMQPHVRLLHR